MRWSSGTTTLHSNCFNCCNVLWLQCAFVNCCDQPAKVRFCGRQHERTTSDPNLCAAVAQWSARSALSSSTARAFADRWSVTARASWQRTARGPIVTGCGDPNAARWVKKMASCDHVYKRVLLCAILLLDSAALGWSSMLAISIGSDVAGG